MCPLWVASFGWALLVFSDRSRAFRHVSAGFQWAEFSMHGFLLSSLWAILRHNGDDDASVLLLIEDGGWNSSLAAVASSSKGGVNIWYPLPMRACCFL